MSHPQWDAVYKEQVRIGELIDHVYSHKAYLSEIIGRSPRSVLEVGVGGGSTSIFLTYLGIKVTAIDNNAGVIASAARNNDRLGGKLEFREADAFRLPYPDDSFDLVCHQGFFEHFEDGDIVRLAREQLRVAPTVVFSVPTRYYLSRALGERLLTRRQWEAIMAPFRAGASFYYGRPRPDSAPKRLLAALGWRSIYYCCVLTRDA